jgi:hypothetical protein
MGERRVEVLPVASECRFSLARMEAARFPVVRTTRREG